MNAYLHYLDDADITLINNLFIDRRGDGSYGVGGVCRELRTVL